MSLSAPMLMTMSISVAPASDGLLRLECFDFRQIRAERKADDGAHIHRAALEQLRAQPDVRRVDTDRRKTILLGFVAQLLDLRPWWLQA